jgi:hypothetical protein
LRAKLARISKLRERDEEVAALNVRRQPIEDAAVSHNCSLARWDAPTCAEELRCQLEVIFKEPIRIQQLKRL